MCDQLRRRLADVDEYLVHHRRNPAHVDNVVDVCRLEVGDADGAELRGVVGVFQGSPCVAVAVEVSIGTAILRPWLRAMDEHHVEVVEAGPGQRLVDGGRGLLERFHLSGELGGHEYLFAGYAAGADSLADACFVAVRLCGVDMAVPNRRRVSHRLCDIVVVDKPRPETDFRDIEAIRERVVLFENHSCVLPFRCEMCLYWRGVPLRTSPGTIDAGGGCVRSAGLTRARLVGV